MPLLVQKKDANILLESGGGKVKGSWPMPALGFKVQARDENACLHVK
jgi:hypothetical protein